MSPLRIWLAVHFTLCALLPVAAPRALYHPAQVAGEREIRDLVERFYAAYRKEELEGLLTLWSAKSPQLSAARRQFERTFSASDKIEVSKLVIKESLVDAGRAKVRLTAEIGAVDSATQKPVAWSGVQNHTLELVREGGAWRVWSYVRAEEGLAAKLIELKSKEERGALLDREAWLVTKVLVEALRARAGESLRQSRYDEALAVFDIALQANERVGDQGLSAWLFLGIGSVHFYRADYEQASGAYRRALEFSTAAGDKTAATAALNNLGNVVHLQGFLQQALDYFKESLRRSEEVGNRRNIALSLFNIGGLYVRLGNRDLAMEYYLKSLSLAEQLGDKSLELLPLGGIGNVYFARGDYARALEYQRRRLQQATELNEPLRISGALIDIGIIHQAQGYDRLALEFFERALRYSEEIGSKVNTAKVLGNIGRSYLSLGDYAKALEYHQRTAKLAEELGDPELLIGELVFLGDIYAEQKSYRQALEQHQKALSLAQRSGYETPTSDINQSIAHDYLALGDPARALEYADRGSDLARRSGDQISFLRARNIAGRALLALNHPAAARRAFLDSIDTIEKIRDQVAGDPQDRQRFFEKKTGAYEGMIRLSLAANLHAEAFAYAERAKGRALLDVFGGERIDIRQAMSSAEQERDRALTEEIASLNTQLAALSRQRGPGDGRALADIRGRLENARLAYENFLTELHAARPELKLRRGEVKTITADETAQLLDEKTAVISYFVGESTTYLFALSKAAGGPGRGAPVNLSVFTIDVGREALGRMAEDFRRKVAARDLTIKRPAQQLFDLLMAPAREFLRGKAELCIVPDGPLWHLPFQALYHKGGYLLEQHAIYYAPSLSVLREMGRKSAAARTGRPAPAGGPGPAQSDGRRRAAAADSPVLLAVGNPLISGEASARVRGLYRGEELAPLPDAEAEVKRLGQMYGPARSKVLIGEGAREDVVKAEGGHYRVLHFAAHAILDDQHPMYSRIMLSPPPGGGKEDGMLEGWEVMRLSLTADLAVLSGCETALGRVSTGEGMIGISWAMFVAGCPTVVASQWKVDSASTSELMIEFHRHLLGRGGGGVTKAEALRRAATSLLKGRRSHPAYWAGFVLIGNGK